MRPIFSHLCLGLTSLALTINACSNDDDERKATSSSVSLSDEATTEVALASTVEESLDSLSDSNFSVSDTAASLLLADTNAMTVTRTCTESEGRALVNISKERERSATKESKRFSFSDSTTSSVDISRSWSKDGQDLKCAANGKHAAIDFESDLSGYKLDISIDRSHTRSSERTSKVSGEKSTLSFESSAKGTRQVSWLSQSTDSSGQLSRKKSMSFLSERQTKATLKNGKSQDLSLSIATLEDNPLVVEVTWAALSESRTLVSKFIESGKIRASQAGAGSIETSFSQVLLKFSTDSCSFYSGTIEAKVFAEGASTASKTYTITANDGELTLADTTDPAAPREIEDFDYSPCDLKDFNF